MKRLLLSPVLFFAALHGASAQSGGQTFSSTSAKAPPDARKAFIKGREALAKGKTAEAAKDFETAVAIYPQYADAWLNLGKLRLRLKAEDAAAQALQKAADADQKLVEAFVYLGMIDVGKKQWEDAARNLDFAVALDPVNFPNAWFNDAVAGYNLKNYDAAEKNVRAYMKLDRDRRNAQADFLLGAILAGKDDYNGAADELRIYIRFAPDGPDILKAKALLADIEKLQPPSDSAPKTTFRTDVRQVLVPVIVADKQGHHITGLTRDDFHVFEDGVEQTITAFSVEDSGLAGEISAQGSVRKNAPPGKVSSEPVVSHAQQIRQTYLICIDTLHSSGANLLSFRGPLLKFFRGEHSADSQYILVAMGTSLEVLQDVTPDREKILRAIQGKQFQKVFQDSRMAAGNFDLSLFREKLNGVRSRCEAGDFAACEEQSMLPNEAKQLASEDRAWNKLYFDQFRKLVETLKSVSGRRSIVLVSDGFPAVPGKEPLDLLLAYFPEFRGGNNQDRAGLSLGPEALDRMDDELDPVLRMASGNNIPIYTIDSRGSYTSQYFDLSIAGASGGGSKSAAAQSAYPTFAHRSAVGEMTTLDNVALEAGNMLGEIAAATGGTAFRSNDLLKGLQLAFADGRQYYMVSYVSTNAKADGKFRAITVKLRDPRMSVKAKRGYWTSPN